MSVTSGADSGPGTLRELIENTTVPAIVVDPSVTSIVLDSVITINRDLSIEGNGVIISITPTMTSDRVLLVDGFYVFSINNAIFEGNLLGTLALRVIGAPGEITVTNAVNVTNCIFKNFQAGSIIYFPNTNIYVSNCRFENNYGLLGHIYSSRYGTLVTGPCSIVIEDCQFVDGSSSIIIPTSISTTQQLSVELRNLEFTNMSITSSETGLMAITGSGRSVTSVLLDNISITDCSLLRAGLRIGNAGTGAAAIENISINNFRLVNNTSALPGIRINTEAVTGVSCTTTLSNVLISNGASNLGTMIEIDQEVVAGQTATASLNNVCIVNTSASTASTEATLELRGDSTYELNNVLVAGSTISDGDAIYISSPNLVTMRNVTVASNATRGMRIETTAAPPLMYNTLLANNVDSSASLVDVVGVVDSNSFNNLVSNGSTMVGITNGTQGNQIGTDLVPIDAMLGSLGVYGGVNDFPVIPLLDGSPAIDAGDNALIQPGTTYDIRGDPLLRVYGGIVDIGAFEWQPFVAPCFLGDSLVKVQEGYVRADELTSKHKVYNVLEDKYVPIKFVAKIEGVQSAYVLQEGLLGENQPSKDLVVTAGHPVLVDGKPVKAKDIPGTIKIEFDRTHVYSVICAKWQPIDVNGIGVYAWSEHKWLDHVKKACVVYEKY